MDTSSGADSEVGALEIGSGAAPVRASSLRSLAVPLVVCGFLALHVALVLKLHSAGLASNVLITLAAAAAAGACFRRRGQCSGTAATRWNLVALGLAFWTIGQLIFTYSDSFRHVRQSTALTSDFYFFIYGVLVLFVVSSPHQRYESYVFLVIDTCQALFAVCLTYVALFAALPWKVATHPLSAMEMMNLYNAENVALAAAATLRLLARPQGEERTTFRILSGFLWTYALFAFPLNYASAVWRQPSGSLADVFWDLPFLTMLVAVIAVPPAQVEEAGPESFNTAAMLAHNGSPIFFTLAGLGMAAYIERHDRSLGFAAISLSLLLYGTRATLLQGRFIRTQAALRTSEHALREANDRLQRLSISDPLTGVANRRQFEHTFAVEWKRACRTRSPISILMIDVDHFKALNDHYGHLRGDECLMQIAALLREKLRRGGELLARYGGEEFVCILPNIDMDAALAIAERLRAGVAELAIPNEGSKVSHVVTASIGVATTLPTPDLAPRELVAAADRALYRAKCNGRDRVERIDTVAEVLEALRLTE